MDPNRGFDRPYGQPDPSGRGRYAARPAEPVYPQEDSIRYEQPQYEPTPYHAGPAEHTGHWAGSPPAMPAPAHPEPPAKMYRARRPAIAALLIVVAAAIGLLVLRALAVATFGDDFLIGGVIASSLVLAALPLLVLGLYALVTGAARDVDQWGVRIWARPPLAYLLVGLALLTAAGLAIS